MFKSKLQELCHRHVWSLPEYATAKSGPDHNTHFVTTITVNGVVFQTPPNMCRSSKEAQNQAAKLAFEHFSSPEFDLPQSFPPDSSGSGMYKSKLQELCHQYSWNLPEYTTVKDGPDHNPRFSTTVSINGISFQSPPDQCRSSKVSQNLAAKLAFDHFTAPKIILQHSPNSTSHSIAAPTATSSGSPAMNNQFATEPVRGLMTQLSQKENVQTLQTNPGLKDDIVAKGMLHLYKNRLQMYAQKKALPLPTYTCISDGPPHSRRYKSKVTIDGKTYETAEHFLLLKDAENASAKVAFESLPPHETRDDEVLYKILLQELSKQEGLRVPIYDTTKSGPPHAPTFVTSVEFGGVFFRGYEAKSKKQAEINAAKAAYNSLIEHRERQNPTVVSPASDMKDPFKAPSSNLQSGVAQQPDISQPKLLIKKEQDKDVHPYNPVMTPFPSLSFPSNGGRESPSPETYPTNPNLQSTNGTRSPKKVIVRPYRPNMTHPPGTTVLPYSDHRWVAVKKESGH